MTVVSIDKGKQIIISSHARAANIGGKSHIDTARTKQREYQLTGYTCEAAYWMLTGAGFLKWDISRCKKNANRFVGDGGTDLGNVDVKGSLVRNPNKPLGEYHLYVRAPEMRAEKYVLCLCNPGFDTVWIMGEATKQEVLNGVKDGNRYSIKARNLRRLETE